MSHSIFVPSGCTDDFVRRGEAIVTGGYTRVPAEVSE
jgi:hypothetical protein